jgi:hypothetical protein
MQEKIQQELKDNGYDFALAMSTEAELSANAACGQLSIITESTESIETACYA